MEIYNTTWWGNAIDTAITAGTEPDFFGSQMKMLTSQQPELVTNGDFATDSDWTKGTGWTISGGKATYDGLNGTQQLSSSTGVFPEIGKIYKVSFDVLEQGSGNNSAYFGSELISAANLAVGSYVFTATATGTGRFGIFGRDGGVFSIDNVSVKIARAEEVEAVKCLADWIHTTALQDLNN